MKPSAAYPGQRSGRPSGSPSPPETVARPAITLGVQKKSWARKIGLVCAGAAAFGLFSANPLLTAAGLLVLPILFILLWNPGEPPVLLFAAAFQWSQVFVPVLRADTRAEPIGLENGLPEMQAAAWLGLAAILAVALGMRIGRGATPVASRTQLAAWASELSPARLLLAYTVALVFSLFGSTAGLAAPGLRQGLLALGLTRWMMAFLVLWSAMNHTRFRPAATVVLLVELILGFGGYFSSFKTVLFLAAIVALGNEVKLERVLRLRTVALVALGLVLTTYWQSVKSEYRAFLNQGTQAQVVLVPPLERVEFLLDRVAEIGFGGLAAGLDSGLQRLGYLDFFAMSIQQVPTHIPYQRGRLWREAVVHVLMPRLLFPSKPAIYDSDRTNEFSGLRVAGEERGTTISLGYVTESYIDFGPALMFAPVGLLGGLWGCVYRWLSIGRANGLLGLSAATTVILMGAILFETSNIMILGGTASNAIVLGVILSLWGRPLWGLLSASKVNRQRH